MSPRPTNLNTTINPNRTGNVFKSKDEGGEERPKKKFWGRR